MAQTLAIGVDHGDGVGLRHQGLRHRRSHLPRAEYDDLHAVLPDASRGVARLLTLFFRLGFFEIHPQRAQLAIEERALHSRLLRHLADAAADLPQLIFEIRAFEIFACLTERQSELAGRRQRTVAACREGRLHFVGLDVVACPQYQQALHQVLQLANIAGPGVMAQAILRRDRETPIRQTFLRHEAVERLIQKIRHVFGVRAQRRYGERHHGQLIIEVLAKTLGLHLLRENSAVELFGAEEGDRVHYGLLEQANGGTLFLDDVGEMDLAVQARLYGALASGACLRVGGSEPVQLDVRVVAATHRDLAQEVQAKRFREDLYYQLAVVPLTVPPLREHAEDVPDLLNQALDRFVAQEGLPYRRFTVAAQNRLRHYAWPGNIRELQNLVQRLLILGTGNDIEADEVEAALAAGRDGPLAPPGLFDLPLREARENFERAYLEYQLRQVGGSIGKVAKQAGMERTHLYRKLRALGMNLKEAKPEEEGE